jgi:hypothetical protein
MRNSPPEELDLRVILWPSGPYLIALSTRARIACSTRAGSTLRSTFSASVVSRAAPSCSAASDPAAREPPEQNARLQPDLRVAPDHGEGRPELVGDFGEKVGLGACGVGEHALHALPLADVARGRLEPDDLAMPIEYGLGDGLEPGVFPRLLADTVDDGDGPLPFERLVVGLRADAFEVVGMEEVVGVGTQKLFGIVAERAPAGGADV